MSDPAFIALIRRAKLPEPVTEFQFAKHIGRRWRMDYAWPEHRVGLEVDGGVWLRGGGRHTRGSGWVKDTEKLNTAASMGWRMLRVTPQQLCTMETIALVKLTLTPLLQEQAAA